jgi:uncharacterized protein YjbJ (UPF0337 family)
MDAESNQVKGRTKEAAGILIGDKDHGSKGSGDRRAGGSEKKIGRVNDKAEEVFDKAKDALHRK